MKKIFFTVLVLAAAFAHAQVAIGKASISTLADNVTPNPNISLEFGTGNKGIVLPWGGTFTNAGTGYNKMSGAVPGTMIFDMNDNRFRVNADGTNWNTLSENGTGNDGTGNTISIDGTTGSNAATNRTIQDNKTELANARTTIGTATTGAPGILVLEDSNKAMVLPKVANPAASIVSPAPGMMVYDTVSKSVAFFNGTVWNYKN